MTTLFAAARRSHLRTMTEASVLAVLAAGLVQTWLIDGLVVPCRVVGGSMAGALLGVHRNVTVRRLRLSVLLRHGRFADSAARAVCPNCGYAANDLESLPDVAADRVLIDRAAFSIRRTAAMGDRGLPTADAGRQAPRQAGRRLAGRVDRDPTRRRIRGRAHSAQESGRTACLGGAGV